MKEKNLKRFEQLQELEANLKSLQDKLHNLLLSDNAESDDTAKLSRIIKVLESEYRLKKASVEKYLKQREDAKFMDKAKVSATKWRLNNPDKYKNIQARHREKKKAEKEQLLAAARELIEREE